MSQKWWKVLISVLLLGSVLAAVKVIFVDYTLDEEYQLVMAYRNFSGDDLFGTMWEPHQTSVFVCVWLMRLFVAVTGSNVGVVVFLRVCSTAVQLLLTVWMYRVLCSMTDRKYAFLLSMCYFNIVPKMIQIPDFSNLQVWFFTVLVLALLQYRMCEDDGERTGGRWAWICLAGLGMALEVLAHPGTVITFPFFLIYIFVVSGRRNRLKNCLMFAGVCGCCAVIWLWRVLSHVPPEEFFRNLQYVMNFDLTHDMSVASDWRIFAIVRDLKTYAFQLAVVLAITLPVLGLLKLREKRKKITDSSVCLPVTGVIAVLAAELVQVFYWLVLRRGYEEPQIQLVVLVLAALVMCVRAKDKRKMLFPFIAGAILVSLAVLYMSDLGIWYAIPHGLPGIILCLLALVYALWDRLGNRSRGWIYLLLFGFAFFSVFGKGFILRAGVTETNTILGIRGVIRQGPCKGIFTNYMQAYITNCDYEIFRENVKDGENCLVVTNMVGAAGTTPYLFSDVGVSHFSVVGLSGYDERLLTYWELYPEKKPDVIVVECWFGQLKAAEDSWIMQYIENDFGYTEVVDGSYLRFYKRN